MMRAGFTIIAALLLGCTNTTEGQELTEELISLATSDARSVDIRIISPENCKDCPLIIFSHGANAAFDRYDALLLPLAKGGYKIAVPNHTDSEEHKNRSNYKPQDWLPTRLEDYNLITEYFESDAIIAAGHSFGALVAQIAGGASIGSYANLPIPKNRPIAVLAFSPPGPQKGYIEAEDWSNMNVPSLTVTGTNDIVPNMVPEWEMHLASYEAAPTGTAFSLIYENMDHYFNGAYGRENENNDAMRQQALMHLNLTSISFLKNVVEEKKISRSEWETHTQDYVEARAR